MSAKNVFQNQVLSTGAKSRTGSIVSRDSLAAREAALRIKLEQEGFDLVEVAYYYKNGKKKKRVKKRKVKLLNSDKKSQIVTTNGCHTNYFSPSDKKDSVKTQT